MIYKFSEMVYETNMTSEKENYHLELNEIGKNFEPFNYYYTDEMDDRYYFILKRIPIEEYRPVNNRVTLLTPTSFKDTDNRGTRRYKLYLNELGDINDYYTYKLVSTERRIGEGRQEIHGVSVLYDKEPERFHTQLTENGREHYILIKKNTNVHSVRTNTRKRPFSGSGAEKTIATRFGWDKHQTGIRKKLIKRQTIGGEIIPDRIEKVVLSDILRTDMETINEYEDLFDIENPDNEIDKYDLIIPEGDYEGKKIEVKRYSARSLFFIQDNIRPRWIMMAEQLSVKTKSGLRRIVQLYKDINGETPQVNELLNLPKDNIELCRRFSTKIKDNETINDIRKFYNDKIRYMYEKYDAIPEDKIMSDVYGVYFFNKESGIDGFLIKSEDEREQNFKYQWNVVESHWGFYRIDLEFQVNPNAYRYVWLGDIKKFAKTANVTHFDLIPREYRDIGKPIIVEGTDYGNIKWDHNKGYWVTTKERGIVDVKSLRKSRSRSNFI